MKVSTLQSLDKAIQANEAMVRDITEEWMDPLRGAEVPLDEDGTPLFFHIASTFDDQSEPRMTYEFAWGDEHEKHVKISQIAVGFGSDDKAESIVMILDSRVRVIEEDQEVQWEEKETYDAFIYLCVEVVRNEDGELEADTDVVARRYRFTNDGVEFAPINLGELTEMRSPLTGHFVNVSTAARDRKPQANPDDPTEVSRIDGPGMDGQLFHMHALAYLLTVDNIRFSIEPPSARDILKAATEFWGEERVKEFLDGGDELMTQLHDEVDSGPAHLGQITMPWRK